MKNINKVVIMAEVDKEDAELINGLLPAFEGKSYEYLAGEMVKIGLRKVAIRVFSHLKHKGP